MKSIQEKQPPYWGKKYKKLTRSTRIEKEKVKLGTKLQPNLKGHSRKSILVEAH